MPPSVYPTETTVYDPEKCWNGYTLYETVSVIPDSPTRAAELVDMNGNTVNLWKGIWGSNNRMLRGGYVMGSSGRLLEVTTEHETVWEYLSPHIQEIRGGTAAPIYRAYRVPYEWVPQADKPEEKAIALTDNSKFRAPGSPRRKAGKVTRVKTGRRS